MPNRELNDPMEKSNEITHVNAELIPQDNSAESDDKSLSRRRVLEAGAAALALLMMPKLAFGATCPGGNPPNESVLHLKLGGGRSDIAGMQANGFASPSGYTSNRFLRMSSMIFLRFTSRQNAAI